MKKWMVSFFMMGLFLSQSTEAKSSDLRFQINYDSHETNFVETKNEVLNLITKTIDHVDKESYFVLLSGDLTTLNQNEQKVVFKKNTLYFQLGDGKGKSIQGSIMNNSFCMVEVKPKSLLKKWFNFFN